MFSAVVTTFVSQTSQKLQRDFTEVTAHKMDEMTKLLRVVIAGNNITDVPPSSLSVATKFVPERSDLWINGLWFTSLALSLTTALLAVLTKQWIHQYMSVPSGTPRDRSRIRQFRFNSLEKWRVPVIIGLLPVLMHISLAVFFAGLIVYLRNLDTPMSGVVTSVAVVGLAAYTGTNLLPLFRPDCPYKTPLTLHSHSVCIFLWSVYKKLLRTWKRTRQPATKTPATDGDTIALSLREVEIERVKQVAVEVEAQCLSWLFNISSNSSVQRVVAQALSQSPLQSVQPLDESIPNLREFIRDILLLPEHRAKENNTTYDRLFRALVKFVPETGIPPPAQVSPPDDSFARLISRENSHEAISFLSKQIVDRTTELDVLSWAMILQNALVAGTGWLGIHREDSVVWQRLLTRFLSSHRCLNFNNCRRSAATLWTIPLPLRKQNNVICSLFILDFPNTEQPDGFLNALEKFMAPSFYDLLWTLAFPSSSLAPFPNLPPDVGFQLDMMRTPYIQHGFGISRQCHNGTTMSDLVEFLKRHLDIRRDTGDTLNLHPNIVQAAFPILLEVIGSDAFLSDSMDFYMKRDLLHALFRILVQDVSLDQAYPGWFTPSLFERTRDVACVHSREFPSPLITEMLEYASLANGSRRPAGAHTTFIPLLYAHLSGRDWLEEIAEHCTVKWVNEGEPVALQFYDLMYPYLASEYVNGLAILKDTDKEAFDETLRYLQHPHAALTLSKLVLLSNNSGRQSLLTLAVFVGREAWCKCFSELQEYLRTADAMTLYQHHAELLSGKHPFRWSRVGSYESYEQLESLLSASMRIYDISRPMLLNQTPRILRTLPKATNFFRWKHPSNVSVSDKQGKQDNETV